MRSAGPLSFLAAVAAVAASGLSGCGERADPPARPSIVLVVVDTLRADAVQGYGAPAGATPTLEALAREGALFERVQAAAPWTSPSMAAIHSGRYPDEVGIHSLRDPLPEAVPTVAERLRDAGYRTGAVVSNALAGPAYGHDQGFDWFHFERYVNRHEVEAPEDARPVFPADQVTDHALAWLDEQRGPEPFFLYVHYTDPHEPYYAPPQLRERFLAGHEALDPEYHIGLGFVQRMPTEGELASLRAHYAAEVAFVDAQLARLLARLPADAVVVVTSDHGEEFAEHGRFLHGHSLYQELLRIPLLVKGPGIPAGARVDVLGSHVDLAPTLLELAGVTRSDAQGHVELEGGFSGRSLVPFLAADDAADVRQRPVFAVLEDQRRQLISVVMDTWKLEWRPREESWVLYDLEQDPRELVDVAGQRSDVVDALSRLQRTRLDAVVHPSEEPLDDAAAEQRERELRAIGYVK